MRVTILSLAVITAGLLGATQTASAQQLAEPNSYNYPWCSISNQGGRVLDGGLGGGFGPSCYYRTRKECEENNGPQLGACAPNLEYRPFPGGLPPIAVDTTARTVASYRYCARSAAAETAQDCYFDTLEECKTEMTGIIGNCYPNPYYRPSAAAATPPPAAAKPRGQAAATSRTPSAAAPRQPVAATSRTPPAAAPRQPVAATATSRTPPAAATRQSVAATATSQN